MYKNIFFLSSNVIHKNISLFMENFWIVGFKLKRFFDAHDFYYFWKAEKLFYETQFHLFQVVYQEQIPNKSWKF